MRVHAQFKGLLALQLRQRAAKLLHYKLRLVHQAHLENRAKRNRKSRFLILNLTFLILQNVCKRRLQAKNKILQCCRKANRQLLHVVVCSTFFLNSSQRVRMSWNSIYNLWVWENVELLKRIPFKYPSWQNNKARYWNQNWGQAT